jgi:hypothetical protein
MSQKTLKAIPFLDEFEGEEPKKFFVLEGNCRKCGQGPNNLVIYEFKLNSKFPSQSIFKTRCISCGDKSVSPGSSLTI